VLHCIIDAYVIARCEPNIIGIAYYFDPWELGIEQVY